MVALPVARSAAAPPIGALQGLAFIRLETFEIFGLLDQGPADRQTGERWMGGWRDGLEGLLGAFF